MEIVMKRGPRGQERPQEKDFAEKRVVRVLPTSDLIRKYVKHQPSKIGWLKEGSVEWPWDTFTRNRLRDGDITIEPAKPKQVGQQQQKKPTGAQPSEPKKPAAKPPEPAPHN
jgi:hypothetical protein